MVLTPLYRKNRSVNSVEPEKIAELTALNLKNRGVSAVVPEKKRR